MSREYFVIREKAEYGDTYSFSLDLSDPEAGYALDFFARVERDAFRPFPAEDIILDLRWFSPSDSILTDTAVVRVSDVAGSDYFSRDIISRYKSPLDLPEEGEWRLKAKVVNGVGSVRGLGVILRQD